MNFFTNHLIPICKALPSGKSSKRQAIEPEPFLKVVRMSHLVIFLLLMLLQAKH